MSFRDRLLAVPPGDRDAWVDRSLGFDLPPDDGPLPRGCVPYLPAPVDALLQSIALAEIGPDDLFVDVGSGVGRALAVVHLLTGAAGIGLELQAGLAARAEDAARRLGLARVRTLPGDAEALLPQVAGATVFFFYCPFDRERLERFVDALRPRAAAGLRLCFVDTPPPERPWLAARGPDRGPVAVRFWRPSPA